MNSFFSFFLALSVLLQPFQGISEPCEESCCKEVAVCCMAQEEESHKSKSTGEEPTSEEPKGCCNNQEQVCFCLVQGVSLSIPEISTTPIELVERALLASPNFFFSDLTIGGKDNTSPPPPLIWSHRRIPIFILHASFRV